MIWVGLPAYNEEGRIASLLMDIHRGFSSAYNEYKIVVYDDGSSDDTAFKVLSANDQVNTKVHLIRGEKNKGLGYVLSYLIDYFVKGSSLEDVMIIMDADGTHSPEHIDRMLNCIQDGFDVVIASRYTPHSKIRGLKFYRRLLSNVVNFTLKTLFPIKGVCDYSCGYRVYTSKILKLAKDVYKEKLVEEHGFACTVELLVKLRRLGIIACEVPLILRYDKKLGPTKMKVVTNVLSTSKFILKSFFLYRWPYKETRKLRENIRYKHDVIDSHPRT